MRGVFILRTRLFERYVFATAIVGLAFLSAGMGGLGEQDPTKIPEPAQDFSATVVDQRDIASDITLKMEDIRKITIHGPSKHER